MLKLLEERLAIKKILNDQFNFRYNKNVHKYFIFDLHNNLILIKRFNYSFVTTNLNKIKVSRNSIFISNSTLSEIWIGHLQKY
jgi:hypothetical protein